MLINFKENHAPTLLHADICVVGSGAASLAFLSKFYHSPYKVVVIEGGNNDITPEMQQLYECIIQGHSFGGATQGRFRVFGGSTTQWGGQALPLSDIDFEERSWVSDSGWPISNNDLKSYFTPADTFLNVETCPYDTSLFSLANLDKLEFSDALLVFSKWSPIPNLRENYRRQIEKSSNITLLLNAGLTGINLDPGGKIIRDMAFANPGGKTGTVKAKHFLLACGGIENARLLLASSQQNSKGIGNENDMVGRFFQDHPNTYFATVRPFNNRKTQAYFNYFFMNKTRFLPRFTLDEVYQKKHHTLNASAYFIYITDEDDTFTKFKEIYRKIVRRQTGIDDLKKSIRLLAWVKDLTAPAYVYLTKKRVFMPTATARFHITLEQEPLADSRITLSEQKDKTGIPKARIEWKFGELTRKTFFESTRIFKNAIEQSGLAQVELDSWIQHEPETWYERMHDNKHHIGSTRMSHSPQKGVVDSNCKVFAIDNLFVTGSSVFPTSGHSNPTFTLICLALRLADHIKTLS